MIEVQTPSRTPKRLLFTWKFWLLFQLLLNVTVAMVALATGGDNHVVAWLFGIIPFTAGATFFIGYGLVYYASPLLGEQYATLGEVARVASGRFGHTVGVLLLLLIPLIYHGLYASGVSLTIKRKSSIVALALAGLMLLNFAGCVHIVLESDIQKGLSL